MQNRWTRRLKHYGVTLVVAGLAAWLASLPGGLIAAVTVGLLLIAAGFLVDIWDSRRGAKEKTAGPSHTQERPVGVYELEGERVELPLAAGYTAGASVWGPWGDLLRVVKMDLTPRKMGATGTPAGSSVFAEEDYDELNRRYGWHKPKGWEDG